MIGVGIPPKANQKQEVVKSTEKMFLLFLTVFCSKVFVCVFVLELVDFLESLGDFTQWPVVLILLGHVPHPPIVSRRPGGDCHPGWSELPSIYSLRNPGSPKLRMVSWNLIAMPYIIGQNHSQML